MRFSNSFVIFLIFSLVAERVSSSSHQPGTDVQNQGKDCWKPCGEKSGPCESFCGTDGLCCRRGNKWIEKGCTGQIGEYNYHTCTAEATHWDYGSIYGPSTWSETYPTCGKDSQSPINIGGWVTSNIPCKLAFKPAYFENLEGSWKNNGHSLQFTLDPEFAYKTQMSGPCFKSIYQLAQIHFHWGSNAGQGSEHTIQGKQSALEMHMVHLNRQYETTDAGNHPDGYLVVGVLFDEGNKPAPKGLGKSFKKYLDMSKNYASNKAPVMNAKFNIADILDLSNVVESHYQYNGSLTTPGCNQAVTWVLATKVLGVTPPALKALRQLRTTEGEPLVNNFRPVQDLNGRVITLY